MFRRQAYYYASAAFIVLWFVNFIAIINQPYIGLTIEYLNGLWFVTSSDPYGEGCKSGVQVGDVILKINNDDTGRYRYIQKWSEAEGASTIEVQRIGQTTDNIIIIPKRPILLNALNEIPMYILGLIFWLLGFITWFKRSFLVQARALFWLNCLISLAIILAPASGRDLLFARECEYIILSSVPLFLINFISVFPNENNNRVNRFGRLILTVISVCIIILIILQSVGILHSISSIRKLLFTTMIIGILLALWNLGALIKLPKDKPEKNQASIVLLGMSIGFLPFVLLTSVPIIFDFQPIVYAQVSSLFVSVIPATWYYVIVNKYLPDSRRLLGTIISFFVAGVIISFVVSYILLLLKVVTTLNLEVYLSSLTLTMVFIVCFGYLRGVISKLLDKFVFREGKQAFKNKILELNASLSSINEEDWIFEEVVKILAIEGAFIAVEDGNGGYLKKTVGRFLEIPSEQADLEEFYQTDQRINLDVKILPDNFPAEVYIPFVIDDFTGGIFLGHRYSHVKFEKDELPLITLIASQLAQRLKMTFVTKQLSKEIKFQAQRSLDSHLRNQGLQGVTTSLFRSLEKERKSVAREIHDGPLQLGLDLNRRLRCLVEESPLDVKSVQAISHMQELVEDLNFELRLICNDLRPPTLTDLGLLPAIELMCEETMHKELLVISLETVGISREHRFREETELAAYRFLQEGITNAVKHSGSTKLKIYIAMREARIELMISDSGKGFDTSKIYDWSLTGVHFGLVGMKERIESLGGDLEISSTIGQGAMLKATMPIIEKGKKME